MSERCKSISKLILSIVDIKLHESRNITINGLERSYQMISVTIKVYTKVYAQILLQIFLRYSAIARIKQQI
jgi:hypothetical protein